MTEMGEMWADHRAYQRQRKDERCEKFARAFVWIRSESRAIGWSVHRGGPDGAWVFYNDDLDEDVTWWPSSGKTATGSMVSTWPSLKAHLIDLGK